MEDMEIILLFQQGDPEALSGLEKTYGRYCRKIAFGILQNHQDTEECWNDVLLRSWESIPREPPRYLKAYLATVTKNLAISCYRKAHTEKRGLGVEQMEWDERDAAVSFEETVCLRYDVQRCLLRALRGRTTADRELFMRRYYEDQPISELSRRYRLTEGCVRTRLMRMRSVLKAELFLCGVLQS